MNRVVGFFNKPVLVAVVVFLVLWSIARRFL